MASVADVLEDTSHYVNPATGEPLTQPTADSLQLLFRFHKSSGTWKVVDSVRAN
jgi:hypothetical protein